MYIYRERESFIKTNKNLKKLKNKFKNSPNPKRHLRKKSTTESLRSIADVYLIKTDASK